MEGSAGQWVSGLQLCRTITGQDAVLELEAYSLTRPVPSLFRRVRTLNESALVRMM